MGCESGRGRDRGTPAQQDEHGEQEGGGAGEDGGLVETQRRAGVSPAIHDEVAAGLRW